MTVWGLGGHSDTNHNTTFLKWALSWVGPNADAEPAGEASPSPPPLCHAVWIWLPTSPAQPTSHAPWSCLCSSRLCGGWTIHVIRMSDVHRLFTWIHSLCYFHFCSDGSHKCSLHHHCVCTWWALTELHCCTLWHWAVTHSRSAVTVSSRHTSCFHDLLTSTNIYNVRSVFTRESLQLQCL